MTSITKYACAFILAGGLAAPALAGQGDAGIGPTTGATSTKDASSGPTKGVAVNSENPAQHGQTDANASPAAVNPGSPVLKGETEMNPNPATASGAHMRVAQKLRADLGKAGFTDITIMPSSFIVRAKNSDGNPVMMVISPDSVTALTEEGQPSNSASNSRHMGKSSNSAGATPGPTSTGGSQPVTPGGASMP
jgi:hypothetical protein